MTPLPNGNMTAAELDRYLAAESAYNAAKEAGRSEDEARSDAIAAVSAKRKEQFLRSVGVEEPA